MLSAIILLAVFINADIYHLLMITNAVNNVNKKKFNVKHYQKRWSSHLYSFCMQYDLYRNTGRGKKTSLSWAGACSLNMEDESVLFMQV